MNFIRIEFKQEPFKKLNSLKELFLILEDSEREIIKSLNVNIANGLIEFIDPEDYYKDMDLEQWKSILKKIAINENKPIELLKFWCATGMGMRAYPNGYVVDLELLWVEQVKMNCEQCGATLRKAHPLDNKLFFCETCIKEARSRTTLKKISEYTVNSAYEFLVEAPEEKLSDAEILDVIERYGSDLLVIEAFLKRMYSELKCFILVDYQEDSENYLIRVWKYEEAM